MQSIHVHNTEQNRYIRAHYYNYFNKANQIISVEFVLCTKYGFFVTIFLAEAA